MCVCVCVCVCVCDCGDGNGRELQTNAVCRPVCRFECVGDCDCVLECVCCRLLFALADVPENTLSLHRSISHLSDKRLGRAATCASLCLRSQQTIRCTAERSPSQGWLESSFSSNKETRLCRKIIDTVF